MTNATSPAPRIYAYRGTTVHIDGERGTITALRYETRPGVTVAQQVLVGAFVHLNDGAMVYVELGEKIAGEHAGYLIASAEHITRDDFDALTGIEEMRRGAGWR